jgi:hypothetical protein
VGAAGYDHWRQKDAAVFSVWHQVGLDQEDEAALRYPWLVWHQVGVDQEDEAALRHP